MLEYVGCGVAMANAVESVKAAADEITLDTDYSHGQARGVLTAKSTL
ncbi:MAG: HAD hydrolase family protein [Lachnospiraceae bacterium]|nr:HAD hydrolase family protein [Lachnospiraceae bacterium]